MPVTTPHPSAIESVHDALVSMYGTVERRPPKGSVLDGLIATILSQNTTNRNSGRAFSSLKQKHPTWADARRAPARSIEAAIRSGGLARTKSRRIKAILQAIHRRHGETSLEHLRKLDDEQVSRDLGELPGVGPKTISCVLLFDLGRDDFPVDTHVHRIARRLGWVSASTTRERTYKLLNPRIPDGLAHSLHVLMVRHGKQTCLPRSAGCERCALAPACPSAFATSDGS